MVTEGRAEGQDAMLEQGKLRAQPKTRENSKEVQNNTERELLAGDKVPRYDVSILVRLCRSRSCSCSLARAHALSRAENEVLKYDASILVCVSFMHGLASLFFCLWLWVYPLARSEVAMARKARVARLLQHWLASAVVVLPELRFAEMQQVCVVQVLLS